MPLALEKLSSSALTFPHYHSKGFHHVRRKGNIFTKKVPIPDEPRKYLDQYILSQGITQSNQAIFSKNGVRLSTRAIRYICQRISAHASLTLPDEEKFHLSPHMLRHTFLKRVADKHYSGSFRQVSFFIFLRYNFL